MKINYQYSMAKTMIIFEYAKNDFLAFYGIRQRRTATKTQRIIQKIFSWCL